MPRLKTTVQYLLENFAPLIAFYFSQQFFGLKVAIGATLVVTVIEIVRFHLKIEKMTPFFIFSTIIALVFGALDLALNEPVFFKFEAGIINLLFAFFFGLSLLRRKPIIQEFAEQRGHVDEKVTEDRTFFFRFLTAVWVCYFVVKAAVYTWINLNRSLEESLLIRVLIGNVSFALMLGFSIGFARPLWRWMERTGLLPSRRAL